VSARGRARIPRIGLVVPGFSASEEDWCIPALLTLVRELARRAEVRVFAIRWPDRCRDYGVHGATVHAFGGGAAKTWSRAALLARALRHIVTAGRREPFDVLHGFWADEPGTLAVLAARWLGVPAVVSLMGGELVHLRDIAYGAQRSPIARILVRTALRKATVVTVGSTYLTELARPRVHDGRLRLLPLGVDTSMFRPASQTDPSRSGPKRLIHVASLAPVKNQALLLGAVRRVVDRIPDLQLRMIGDGPMRARLGEAISALALHQNVTMLGEIVHHHLPDAYRDADVCVSSSRFESQAMVVLEAAACGVPSVGTAVGILPDLGAAARAVPHDEVALADAMLSLLTDEPTRRHMSREARAVVMREYRIEHTVDRLLALYTATREAAVDVGVA
jgi:glycosyltransferase involved in cell wall biosynthesis